MKNALISLGFVILINCICHSQTHDNRQFNLEQYRSLTKDTNDYSKAFQALFEDVRNANGGVVTIPPGDYHLSGGESIPLSSNTTVFAHGARFYLPKELGDKARIVLFNGSNISNFSWEGGHFEGYIFNPHNKINTWEPNVNTRIFVISTTLQGKTSNLTFRDISSIGVSGAVINVEGYKVSEAEVGNFATNITVENCVFLESGKFMWDYGFLWQIVVFPEDYTSRYKNMANKYYENALIHSISKINESEDRIFFENFDPLKNELIIPEGEIVCLFNDSLPENIKRGKQYFVVKSTKKYIKLSEEKSGLPLIFKSNSGDNVKLINQLRRAFMRYAPIGAGPGKGCIDLVGCKYTKVSGCKISALGDAMYIHSSHYNVFSNNHIEGARMGAFFLAEYCKNSTIIGNIVDGTNGSRVVSIERSNEDVVVIGNTFRNGGRGCWINQPKNLIMKDNIFINNTTKGEHDPWRGRKDYKTGEWQKFAEIYFTTWEKDASYGPVILKDNIFVTGPEAAAAVQFEKNGMDIFVEGNIFKGETGGIFMDDNDEAIFIKNNYGATVYKGSQYSKSKYGN